jgi:hypothetical protein
MRALKRVFASAALCLPLLASGFGAAALADGGQPGPGKAPKPSSVTGAAKQHGEQAQSAGTEQNNRNVSPVRQTKEGGGAGDQSAMTWTQQGNTNTSDLGGYQEQDED